MTWQLIILQAVQEDETSKAAGVTSNTLYYIYKVYEFEYYSGVEAVLKLADPTFKHFLENWVHLGVDLDDGGGAIPKWSVMESIGQCP